ncbi:MAG: type II toxin-antitoxin system Phd/YefM family antitoxin [Opitutaceae bacterium]
MKTANVTESKNALSELLRSVKAGQSILILDRDEPVARLEPVPADALPADVRLRALERRGLIRRPTAAGNLWKKLEASPRPKLKTGRTAVAAVMAERNEGR